MSNETLKLLTNNPMKKSFILHMDSLDVVKKLSTEMKANLFDAIISYNKGEEIKMDFFLDIVFTPFKNQFDRDNEKYDIENKETFLYHIKLKNECDEFIKIGISNFLSKRYADYKRIGYEVTELFVTKFNTKSDAEFEESKLHEMYLHLKYNPKEKFCGYTECFSVDILNHMSI